MPTTIAPDWTGARWIGSVDVALFAEGVTGTVPLVQATGYLTARLLVRDGSSVRGFVEVPIAHGALSVSAVRRAIEALPPTVATPSSPASLPSITVVVCTRDRASFLRTALGGIIALDYPHFDIVVVDNAPRTSETADMIRAEYASAQLTLVTEPTPGLARARNTGLLRATGDIVAYTDDDVLVDPLWLRELVAGFQLGPTVECVAGLVPSGELRNQVQGYFDGRVSWSKNLTQQVFSLAAPPPMSPLFPFSVGDFGTGANFALRRETALRMGGFDTAFGVGTSTGGGEDIDMFTRVLLDQHSLVVQPTAIVWHRHRDDLDALRVQARGYGTGLGAWLTKILLAPHSRRMVLARSPRAILRLARMAKPAAQHNENPADDTPLAADLTKGVGWVELASVLRGPVMYARQRRAGATIMPPSAVSSTLSTRTSESGR
jgi:glycosyltransferase involved in cell wall biosynthesis